MLLILLYIVFSLQWSTSNTPLSVATDTQNNVYVVDEPASTITKYDSSGNALLTFPSFGAAPGAIATDSLNNVYVTTSTPGVQKLTSTGIPIINWTTANVDSGIAIDTLNNVYVADPTSKKVIKYNSSGTQLTMLNTTPARPEGIGTDSSNNVYVACGAPDEIQKYDSIGNFITSWSLPAAPAAASLAVDSSNTVYVTLVNNYLVIYTSSGTLLDKFVLPGTAAGVAADKLNNVYVLDSLNNMVTKFQPAVTANPISVTANGTATSTITAIIQRKNPPYLSLPVNIVSLSAGSGSSIITPATTAITDVNGHAVFTVTDTVQESVTYTADDVTNFTFLTKTATVSFVNVAPTTPTPPSNLAGKRRNNNFATVSEYFDTLTWTASPDPTVVGYNVYQGNILVAVVASGEPTKVKIHNRAKNKAYTYNLVSFNSAGIQSAPISVTVD